MIKKYGELMGKNMETVKKIEADNYGTYDKNDILSFPPKTIREYLSQELGSYFPLMVLDYIILKSGLLDNPSKYKNLKNYLSEITYDLQEYTLSINLQDGYNINLERHRWEKVKPAQDKRDKEKIIQFLNLPEIKNLVLSYKDKTDIITVLEIIEERINYTGRRLTELAKKNEKLEKDLEKKEKALKEAETKKGKFKRSGHLADQMLKYVYPKGNNPQLSIFDSLQEVTKRKIGGVAGVNITEIVEGIKLSPSETKIIDCLCKVLHENSQTSEPKKKDYYSGNTGLELVEYGGDKDTPAPQLAFTLYELTKEYKGGEYVAGKDIENVKQLLTELDSKQFLLSYVETTTTKKGRTERKIEEFRKLISIIKLSKTEYNKEDIELSKKEETIIVLNPIFRRQIESKFIFYPNDINRRTIIAYGSHNVSDIALRLRDYLMRELSSKHTRPEISLDKLYYQLAQKWMEESRKKKVKQYTEKAIETVKALGLIKSYEIKTAKNGEKKIVFTLNMAWE